MESELAHGSFLPDWNAKCFHVLDPSEVWGPAICRELAARWKDRAGFPSVVGSQNPKQLQQNLKSSTPEGLLLFFEGIEKHCLAIIGRLMDDPKDLPIAAILNREHRDLIPVLLESGVTTVMMEPINDIPMADWCLTITDIRKTESQGTH